MLKITNELSCDVLCVGGGVASMLAAISAAQEGASVLVADKANTMRSGSAATGNDHFCSYNPEVHGPDMEPIIREITDSQVGACHDPQLTRRFFEESFAMVRRWEDWGIKMRPTGKWSFKGHAFPTRPRIWLHFDGTNLKSVLTGKAKEAGVKILNHAPVLDVIQNEKGEVCGALALDVSREEPSFILIKAKKVMAGTGTAQRLYKTAGTPGMLCNQPNSPSCTGGTVAFVWRSGGKLVNMDVPYHHAGPKYFQRSGKATFVGVYRLPDGRPAGPFITEPDCEHGDPTVDAMKTIFADLMNSGRGPGYFDCSGAPEAYYEQMFNAFHWEGGSGFVESLRQGGVDLHRHALEFMLYEPIISGRGAEIDINARTSVPNLYAAGDPVGNFMAAIAGASCFGWIGGRHAAQAAKQEDLHQGNLGDLAAGRMEYYSAFTRRSSGPDWKEANLALQQIMDEYAPSWPGKVRSATLLEAGIHYLGMLRDRIENEVRADNAHTLMRTSEVLELLDCGEAVMHSALERKETRGSHIRSDYPYTNPLMTGKFINVWKENGTPRTAVRKRGEI